MVNQRRLSAVVQANDQDANLRLPEPQRLPQGLKDAHGPQCALEGRRFCKAAARLFFSPRLLRVRPVSTKFPDHGSPATSRPGVGGGRRSGRKPPLQQESHNVDPKLAAVGERGVLLKRARLRARWIERSFEISECSLLIFRHPRDTKASRVVPLSQVSNCLPSPPPLPPSRRTRCPRRALGIVGDPHTLDQGIRQ